MLPVVTIEYCSQCRFILRAAWMAQEILMTFAEDVQEVSLRPGKGGVFNVYIDGELLYSKQESGRFPESSELKQMMRDRIAPDKDLGHSDVKKQGE
ncbi:MAG: SelT/SelW/SelH family protein [Gammaproteobacteria bacterium]|nr:SelT/SelW/SelH family protein [Gammaproteobacteria bacterium]